MPCAIRRQGETGAGAGAGGRVLQMAEEAAASAVQVETRAYTAAQGTAAPADRCGAGRDAVPAAARCRSTSRGASHSAAGTHTPGVPRRGPWTPPCLTDSQGPRAKGSRAKLGRSLFGARVLAR